MKNLLTAFALAIPMFAFASDHLCDSRVNTMTGVLKDLQFSQNVEVQAKLPELRVKLEETIAKCNAEKEANERQEARVAELLREAAIYKAEARRALEEEAAKEAKERERLASLPGASIGMTAKQVIERTSWGKPSHVNRTITKNMVSEQWVYDGNYLYFTNGRLTAIQN